jgi:hypothetical protein
VVCTSARLGIHNQNLPPQFTPMLSDSELYATVVCSDAVEQVLVPRNRKKKVV